MIIITGENCWSRTNDCKILQHNFEQSRLCSAPSTVPVYVFYEEGLIPNAGGMCLVCVKVMKARKMGAMNCRSRMISQYLMPCMRVSQSLFNFVGKENEDIDKTIRKALLVEDTRCLVEETDRWTLKLDLRWIESFVL